MSTVLTIDQGTSGTKALVVDGGGDVLGLAEEPVRPRYLPGGGVEQDPHEMLASVVGAGRAAVAAAGVPIDVVTLANQGETVLAWDPDTGRPLSDMIVWQDRRAEGICAELAEHSRRLRPADRAGARPLLLRAQDGVAAPQRHPRRRGHHLRQLAGPPPHREFVTDPSTASRSLLTDLDTTGWDDELLGLFGLGDERLPTIMPCDAVVGSTTAFGGTAAVGGLVVDQQAALVGEGCLRPGEAKCTFGTGAFLLANTGTTATRSTARAWPPRSPGRSAGRARTASTGRSTRPPPRCAGWNSSATSPRPPTWTRSPHADSGGVLAVPALAGLAAPWWRPDAKATISGMTLSTTVGHLVVAILQGIAAQVAELGSAVAKDLGRPLTRLRVDGGLTRCRTLMQSVADLMQIEIEVYPSAHATALGAAALARMAHDPALSLADAVVPWDAGLTYQPTLVRRAGRRVPRSLERRRRHRLTPPGDPPCLTPRSPSSGAASSVPPSSSPSPTAASTRRSSKRTPRLAYGASGTNSGILHTGFDAKPGELETALILRAATLRDPVLDGARPAGAALRRRAPAAHRRRARDGRGAGRQRPPQRRRPSRCARRTARSSCPASR